VAATSTGEPSPAAFCPPICPPKMIFLLHQGQKRFFVHRRYYRVVWRLLNYQRPVQMATFAGSAVGNCHSSCKYESHARNKGVPRSDIKDGDLGATELIPGHLIDFAKASSAAALDQPPKAECSRVSVPNECV